MEEVDNNQFEVKPTSKSKRKIANLCPNVYLNPALDLLANEDPICNTAMEIMPVKKRKRTRSLDTAAFENSALDLGISKAAVNEFLIRELDNVRKNFKRVGTLSTDIPSTVDLNLTETTSKSLDDIPFKLNYKNDCTENFEPQYANLNDINVVGLPETPYVNEDTKANEVFNSPTDIVNIQSLDNSNTPVFESISTENATIISHVPINNNQQVCLPASKITEHDKIVSKNTSNNHIETEGTETLDGMEISRIDELDSGIAEQKSLNTATTSALNNLDLSAINATNIQTHVTNQIFINSNSKNDSNFSLSFIDRLGLDSPNVDSLCFDDDLNESNIMEIKTITIITKKKRIPEKKKSTNPFLDPNLKVDDVDTTRNPFLDQELSKPELEYTEEAINKRNNSTQVAIVNPIMPRRLFANDTNSTMSTMNESINVDQHEYENIDMYRSESPIYENVCEESDDNSNDAGYNKQSRVLGYDVSKFSAVDIMNINKNSQGDTSNDSNGNKKDLKHQLLKAGNKLSKKVFKTLKKTFKGEKPEHNITLNPYEVPRKPVKQKSSKKDSGIENPALNLDGSDEIDIEEIEDEDDQAHQYETIKTIINTRLNMNVTPLRERCVENIDVSQNKTNTPGKKVRFDSTLNQEKVITGNSFDYDLQSPGFDSKIDKYHDELENCINERKFLRQNM